MRGDAEIHQDANDRISSDEIGVAIQCVTQLAEGRVHDADATLELGEPTRGGGSGIGVTIDAKNAKLRSVLQDRVRVATAAERGVDNDAGRPTGEELAAFRSEERPLGDRAS